MSAGPDTVGRGSVTSGPVATGTGTGSVPASVCHSHHPWAGSGSARGTGSVTTGSVNPSETRSGSAAGTVSGSGTRSPPRRAGGGSITRTGGRSSSASEGRAATGSSGRPPNMSCVGASRSPLVGSAPRVPSARKVSHTMHTCLDGSL